MIKNVIVDIGNVLLEWNEDNIVKNISKDLAEQEKLKEVIFQSKDWAKLDAGTLTYTEAIQLFERKLPISLKARTKDIMNSWYQYMLFYEKTCKLVKVLKEKKYNLYILSNTHIPVYEYIKNSEIGDCFDGYIISSIERVLKPNKQIYIRLFEKFQLKPEECYFIDDSELNIESAKECGMDGFVFQIDEFEKLRKDLIEKKII